MANARIEELAEFSPVEQIIIPIYLVGNVPEAICQTPKTWHTDNIKEFQNSFDSMLTGNLEQRRRVVFIPNAGGKRAVQFTKRTSPLKRSRRVAGARGVLGFFGFAAGADQADEPRDSGDGKERSDEDTVTPLRNWLASLINWLVRKSFGYDYIEFAWGESKDKNRLKQA